MSLFIRNKALVMILIAGVIIPIAFSACGAHCDTPASSVFFVTNPKGHSHMEALIFGKLVVTDGVLRLVTPDSSTSYLPIWPKGFKLCLTKDGQIKLLNNSGRVVARVGDEVEMSGGGAEDSDYMREWMSKNQNNQRLLPQPVTFWFAGSSVGLSMRLDSQLFGIDIVPTGDGELLFLWTKPLLDLWVLEDEGLQILG